MSCVCSSYAQPSYTARCRLDYSRISRREECLATRHFNSKDCNSQRRSAYVTDEWQRAVVEERRTYGLLYSSETITQRMQSAVQGYILAVDFQLKTLFINPEKKTYRSFWKFNLNHVRRSEFCEAMKGRRPVYCYPVNASANFVYNPSWQSYPTEHGKHRVRGLHDDSGVPSYGSAVIPEKKSAKIKVIGAGAGASVILNYCQQSSLFPSAQFWYSPDSASEPVLLSNYVGESHSSAFEFEFDGQKELLAPQDSKEEMVFLILGAGSGPGLGLAPGHLKAVMSQDSLVVGIFIQPFMFEGPKRLEQASQLLDGLLECTDILLVVEQDGLLKRDVVTVSEASSIAKNAVLLSIKTISELFLGRADAHLDTSMEYMASGNNKTIIQNAGKSWLGCGRGHNFKEAIEMATAEAPVIDSHSFEGNRLVLCTLASASGAIKEEMVASESVVLQTLGPEVQPIVSYVKNPMLETGVKLATIIITGSSQEQGLQKVSETFIGSQAVVNGSPLNQEDSVTGAPDLTLSNEMNRSPQKPKQQQQIKLLGTNSSVHSYGKDGIRNVDVRQMPLQGSIASSTSQKSRLALGWEAGPSSDLAEAWAKARAQAREPMLANSGLELKFTVGVQVNGNQYQRPPSMSVPFSPAYEVAEDKWTGNVVPVDPDAQPRNQMMGIGLEVVWDMYNAASALVMGKESSVDMKQSSLSQRAASMLESERSHKKLTPLVEMGFKNGSYRGRCRGGLPEGKGRLTFRDGSFYDGQWKQGKRVGSGAFYYTNGDMFQGSWKDDVMHGKGWMYYYNGDRFYANFWKGKADGEGRFYSAQGDIFFGQFRENWRHGEFLHIEASGVRWTELWDSGILKSRTPADS